MPNWCTNKLTVMGSYEDVRAFRDKAKGQSPWQRQREMEQEEEKPNLLSFHNFVPVPQDILAAGYNMAGHLWEVANWGCKWGAYQTRIIEEWDGLVVYAFDTAWSPPIEFMEKVAKQFSTLTMLLDYEEQSMGFKGIAKFKGETKEDHCLTY